MYYLPYIIQAIQFRELRKAQLVVRMREKRNACRFLVRKREGKRPLRRCRRRWEDKKIIALDSVDWIDLSEYCDRLINVVHKLSDSTNFVIFLD